MNEEKSTCISPWQIVEGQEKNALKGRAASKSGENGEGALAEMAEVWKPVIGYESSYEVSSFGRVRRGPFVMSPSVVKQGYCRLVLCVHDVKKSYFVHRLVAFAFCPGHSPLKQVNHKNGIKTDNTASNLEWVSDQENRDHAKTTGLLPTGSRSASTKYPGLRSGERNGNAKIQRSQIPIIQQMRKSGMTLVKIASHFNVTFSCIHRITTKASWNKNPTANTQP